jgi:hypothetical protein
MSKIYATACLFLIYAILSGSGCRKKTFESDSTYAEEMTNFINADRDGKALFGLNIFSDASFLTNDTLLGDSTIRCFYKYDSTVRKVSITIADTPSDIYPYQYVYDALAKIIDVGYGDVYRIIGIDTLYAYKLLDSLIRYAYFVKLYNDSYIYRGWRLLGYVQGPYMPYLEPGNRRIVGNGNISMSAVPAPGVPPNVLDSYQHNRNFIPDDTIPKFQLGDSLTLYSKIRDVIFTENGSDDVKALNVIPYQTYYRIGWRGPSATDMLYHLVRFNIPGKLLIKYVGGQADTTYLKIDDYVIPFKIDI